MNPKMTFEDAANWLGQSQAWVYAELKSRGLKFSSQQNYFYFEHSTATAFFQVPFQPKIVVFQILKGGTGKTSLAFEFAVRAHLYGARVLCIDLDQQANLTQAFDQTAEDQPVMVDCLAEGYPFSEALRVIKPGLDLLPSRIENALLDEVIRLKEQSLEQIYRAPFLSFKTQYDLIVVDCPPSLGQSVAAAALAADLLIAPVIPDKFALTALQATYQSLEELSQAYQTQIPLKIVCNKFDSKRQQSQDIFAWLQQHPHYQDRLLDMPICLSSIFPNATLQTESIFDAVLPDMAKQAMDRFTRSVLGLEQYSTAVWYGGQMPLSSALTREKELSLTE